MRILSVCFCFFNLETIWVFCMHFIGLYCVSIVWMMVYVFGNLVYSDAPCILHISFSKLKSQFVFSLLKGLCPFTLSF